MALKDLAALYGRLAFIVVVFAFVAGIIAGPLLPKSGLRSSDALAQEHGPAAKMIRAKTPSAAGAQG